jgi:phage terminase Nu1 subunit (DNA packaging protein)
MKKEELLESKIRLEIEQIEKCGFKNKVTLNESQAAEIINVSASTLANWRKDGIGPSALAVIRKGSQKPRWLYPKRAIAEWLVLSEIRTC